MVVRETSPVVSAPEMKKKELIEAAVERAGVKKKDAKPAIEAALAILGEALSDGRDLNLQPLGKIKVQKTKELSNGTVMNVRIRRSKQATEAPAPDPFSEAAE